MGDTLFCIVFISTSNEVFMCKSMKICWWVLLYLASHTRAELICDFVSDSLRIRAASVFRTDLQYSKTVEGLKVPLLNGKNWHVMTTALFINRLPTSWCFHLDSDSDSHTLGYYSKCFFEWIIGLIILRVRAVLVTFGKNLLLMLISFAEIHERLWEVVQVNLSLLLI